MNEKVFIVGLELNNSAAYKRFEEHNFSFSRPVKIVPGLYALKTSFQCTSEQIRNDISNMFTGQCQIFVMKSSIDASWRLPTSIDMWLKLNI